MCKTNNSRFDCVIDRIADRVVDRVVDFLRGSEGPSLRFTIGPVTQRSVPMPPSDTPGTLVLTDSQRCRLSIAPKDAAGNPAGVENPQWNSSDPSVCTVTPADDGLSALCETTGALGTCQVSVSADADLGAGTAAITGTLDINVVAGQATTLGITAGSVESRV